MQNFWLWFSTGLEHITDIGGYDHILFVTLLTISYTFKSWKKLLVMITAFTLGHSISLALSVLTNLNINTSLIEFLIAFSVFLTAIYQLWKREKGDAKWIYIMVVLFGLIHGTGFSYLLKAMLGGQQAIAMPLLYFNLGLEAGQLIIVGIVLSINLVVSRIREIPYHIYKIVVVSLIGVGALKMCVGRVMEFF